MDKPIQRPVPPLLRTQSVGCRIPDENQRTRPCRTRRFGHGFPAPCWRLGFGLLLVFKRNIRPTKRPLELRTELIGYYTITHFVFASLVAVNDGVPLVCLVFTHRVVVLVIAEFCTIGGVFVETMTRDGRDNFNAGRFLWHGEVHLSEVARFVVVCTIKLATAKGIGAVDGTSTAAPVAKQEGDGQIAFVGSSILETTLFTVVKHEQIGGDIGQPHTLTSVGGDPSNRLGRTYGIVVSVTNEEISEVIPLVASSIRAIGFLVPVGALEASVFVVDLKRVITREVVW